MSIDTSSDLWKRAQERFATEEVIWLTTTSRDGTPQPNPVWFIDEGVDLIVFSKPNQAKLKNIQRNGRVSLNLETGAHVQILTGSATIVDQASLAAPTLTRYIAKYEGGMRSLNATPDQFSAEYSTVIRISLDHLRGW